jgi:group II intron reverse transcriptase/maturase
MRNRQTEEHVQAVLAGIANRARVSKRHRFGGVYTLLNEETLRWSFYNLNRKAAPGVDEVTWVEYERDLDANLLDLVERLKRKAYRARLVRRHYIPKGNGKRRPLGIPVLEDKLVQHAAKAILEAIYEADFVEYSFAYRPERSAKDAASELCFRLQFAPLSWLVEADIKSFFDNIDHDWMLRMLEERIDDRAFVRLIRKWLKAGVLEDIHTVSHPATGTPQGGVISPILANIYLHYALDLWFEQVVKKEAKGECLHMRYADDFVDAFRYKADAERFYREQLPERLAKFGLSLAPDKTRMLRFSRYEVHKSERFEFLGYEFRWGQNRHKRPQVKRRTARKKLRSACREMQAWIKKNRHKGIRPIMATLARKLRGHWNYFGVPHNSKSLWEFYSHACKLVYKWLNRRSQRRSFTWERFDAMLERYAIPKPRIAQKAPKRRYAYS